MFSILGKRPTMSAPSLTWAPTLKNARTSSFRRTNTRYRRAATNRRMARRVVGTGRQYVARVVREMPLYAPLAYSRPEMKYVDAAVSAGCDTTGTATFLTPIPLGSGMSAREGTRVTLCGVQLRGKVASGPTTFYAKAALILVYDRETKGAAPAITDVLTGANSEVFQNTANRSRFDILARWDYECLGAADGVTQPQTGREVFSVDKKVTFNRVQVWDEDPVGTTPLAHIISGGLFLICVGDNPAGNQAAIFKGNARVMYGDQ